MNRFGGAALDRSAILSVGLLIYGFLGSGVESAEAVDLGERYRATLDYSEQRQSYDWTCQKEDIWRLTAFRFEIDDRFCAELGPSHVVFGRHGSNVLWAAVLPDEPGALSNAPVGRGEHITSVWLRFHPSRVGEFFPPGTVSGQGDAALLSAATRLAMHKFRNSWHAGKRAIVPPRNSVIVDLETREGARRFYSIDTSERTVQYFDSFRTKPLPAPHAIDRSAALEAFDSVWEAFDRQYAMFVLKPEVDWGELRDTYRAQATTATTDHELGVVLSKMLAHLKDLHVHVQVGDEEVPGYDRERPLNASWNAIEELIGSLNDTGHDALWGITEDGVGYINVLRLADHTLPQAFDEALGNMQNTKGLIIDLRFNGGGSERLAQQMAGRLLDKRRIYCFHQLRTGPKHSDLGTKIERACGPSGPWHYRGPVIVLIGQRTMSSAESFALMLSRCPQVKTLGDRTAGSSGNPRRLQVLGGRIVVSVPQWLDMGPDGRPIEGAGIVPDFLIETDSEDFTDTADPVLAAALAKLRGQSNRATANVLTRRRDMPPPPAAAGPRVPRRKEDATDRPLVVSVFPADGAANVNPVTEIRIRFNQPMNANSALLDWNIIGNAGFRLRAPFRYDAGKNEFVIPVSLTPGTVHRVKINQPFETNSLKGFRSAHGLVAWPHTWAFSTARMSPSQGAETPHLVSVDPPPGSKTSVFTPIRVKFDRPMVPDLYEISDAMPREPGDTAPSLHFPVRYDDESFCFMLPMLLPPQRTFRIKLHGFWSVEGGEAHAITLAYEVDNRLLSEAHQTRIAEAARSEKLLQIVDAVRRSRRAITSLEETVRTRRVWGLQSTWATSLRCDESVFRFQGERQFVGDVSGIMEIPFAVGSDGRQCWIRRGNEMIVGRSDMIDNKNLLFCDPFGLAQFRTPQEAIDALQLEYIGTEQYDGRTCHRIRSWKGELEGDIQMARWRVTGIQDWLIDAETFLPAVVEGGGIRNCYSYLKIGKPIAEGEFQPPSAANMDMKAIEPLGKGYDRRFLIVRDGSDGRMSVRWGKTGSGGRRVSSGLN